MSRLEDLIHAEITEILGCVERLQADKTFATDLASLSLLCADSLRSGGIIFFAGNGGSFADAQHLAAEFSGKMGRSRIPLAGLALGTNSSSLSAIGNDYGFGEVFARELDAFYRPGSVLIALSTSGRSENVRRVISRAIERGMPVALMTGSDFQDVVEGCHVFKMPCGRTERIQELHTFVGHLLCLLVEEELGVCTE